MKNIFANILVIFFLGMIVLIPIVFSIVLSIGALLYFGVTYESTSDFILFFVLSVILVEIFEFLFKTIVQVCYDFKIITKGQSTFFKTFLDFSASMLSLLIVDSFMTTVSIPLRTLLLYSILTVGIDYFMSNTEEEPIDETDEFALEDEIEDLLDKNNVLDTIKILKENHPELSIAQIKNAVQKINEQ